jgi:hypothetical protein
MINLFPTIKKLKLQISKQKGFAMLFAVLVSSVLLSIGLSIFNLTVKELVLSSSGRESQFAFYAADTGAECALYWDLKGDKIFATSTYDATRSPANPDCVDVIGIPQLVTVTNYVGARTSTYAQTQFELTIPNIDAQGNSAPYCAIVTVTKDNRDSGGNPDPHGIIGTTIDSRGYNTACDSTDLYRVERALQITY